MMDREIEFCIGPWGSYTIIFLSVVGLITSLAFLGSLLGQLFP